MPRSRSLRRALLATLVSVATAAAGLVLAPQAAEAASTGLVISEAYGGGGNGGSTYKNDFIELYNYSASPISVAGMSVQYRSSTGTAAAQATELTGSVPAHGHYLVQEAAGTGGTTSLPTPDATGTISMGGSAFTVYLATATTPLTLPTGSVTGNAQVVDLVGSNSNTFEGTTGAAVSNTTSISRNIANPDSDVNSTDFTVGAPSPQNAGPAALSLANPGTQNSVKDTPITPLSLQASGGSGTYTYAATGLPSGLLLDPSTGQITGTPDTTGDYTVHATADDGSTTASVDFVWHVAATVVITPIADIQGTDTDTSPYNTQTVTTEGVVTAAYPTGGFNGFYIQTPGNPNTPGASDAVFVFGSAATAKVQVGDSVKVTGEVSEFHGSTELTPASASDVTVLDSSLGTVTPLSAPWADLDTSAEKEAHEGELVAPQGDFTVTDNYNINFHGEIELASGDRMLDQPTDVGTPGSAEATAAAAYNTQHQVFLDDGSSWTYSATSHSSDLMPWLTPTTPVSDGARATFQQPVVLEYRNNQWNFQPRQQLTGDGSAVATFSDMRTGNAAPANVGGDVRLATFNMENFFTTTGDEFVSSGQGTCTFYKDRQGNEITDNNCSTTGGEPGPRGAATDATYQKQLNKELVGIDGLGASVVSLEEVENAVKFGEDRDATVAALVAALNAKDGAGTWAFVPSPAAGDLPPVGEQDVIRTAFIYKPAAITPVGVSHVLTGDSDAGEAFSIAREPMAQGFKATGAPDSAAFMVVANHLKSKGADASGLFSDCGPGGTIGTGTGGDAENTDPVYDQGGFNCSRVHQVHDMWAWAQQQALTLGTNRVFLVGDFNAYDHEDPIEYLYGQGFTDLASTYDASHSSYSYGGLEGSLDHVLATPAALAMVTGATIWQIDAQEAVAFAYSRDNYNVTQLYDGATPWATSDHDPEIVGLDTPEPSPTTTTTTVGDVHVSYGRAASVPVTVTSTVGTPSGTVQLMDGTTVVATGSLDAAGKMTFTVPARTYPPGTRTLTVRYAGDATHAASEKSFTLAVVKASSTTTVKVEPRHPKARHHVKLKVEVRAADGVVATGQVTIKVHGEERTGTLENGKLSRKLGGLAKGVYHARVSYLGDGNVEGSRTTVTITVT